MQAGGGRKRVPSAPEARCGWKRVGSSELLARAFHTANLVGGKLVVFGGVRSVDPRVPPLNDLVVLEPSTLAVERVVTGGPPRSHHGAVTLQDRWLLSVGGWDGKRRVAEVHAFDLETGGGWRELTPGHGSQPPAGLSGHTCNKISERELLIVGREGGIHMQRRFASVFTLHIDAHAQRYWYKERESHTASRSGHSAILARIHGQRTSGYKLLVFGGRNSTEIETVRVWTEGEVMPDPLHAPRLTEHLRSLITSGIAQPMRPGALRHHSMTLVGPFAVLYGGECFNKTTDTVCNDLFLYDTRSPGGMWFHLPTCDPEMKRVGHRVVVLGESLCLTGGRGRDGKSCCPQIYTLDTKG
ncbi:kelch domain-containing protein 9-like [Carcharodon carcharias]|uniref:kelch domain-containing protein 9-like n=1 Tax=Carcharodon carcharias TaxID=13397 RepID=UPI001B7E4EA8|nr:kelch domain-containing protein 9-like [Carcharodon carcharias]